MKANLAADVPLNQHTLVQSVFLEMMLAFQCQLTGIDLVNPGQSCLGVNMSTHELSYDPSQKAGQGQIGGVLGAINQGIGAMYTPTFSASDYTKDLSANFGIVKPALAQTTAYTGFQGLQPIIGLWKVTRDISYFLLVIAFIFIGIGVMLRLRIDPRTVMTIQNQIPRVIICIILITFSYAFAGIMIDAMWAVTYMGVNKITGTALTNPALGKCGNVKTPQTLNSYSTSYILNNPLTFAEYIFVEKCSDGASGILSLSWGVSQNISAVESNLFLNILLPDHTNPDCGLTSLGDCFWAALRNSVNFVLTIFWFLVVLIALIISLFRIWFELLKAYVMLLIYVVLAPIWIVFGLLPKKPLGFEKWLRAYFANLAIFPATAFILVGARVFHEIFNTTAQYRFVPPLIGNPATGNFGMIVEFAMILIAPHLLGLIREKLGTPPVKQLGAAAATFSAGRAAAGAPAKKAIAGWTRRNPTTGAAEAPGSRMADTAKRKIATTLSKVGSNKGKSTEEKGFFAKRAARYAERIQNQNEGIGRMTDAERTERSGGTWTRPEKNQQQAGTNPTGGAAGPSAAPGPRLNPTTGQALTPAAAGNRAMAVIKKAGGGVGAQQAAFKAAYKAQKAALAAQGGGAGAAGAGGGSAGGAGGAGTAAPTGPGIGKKITGAAMDSYQAGKTAMGGAGEGGGKGSKGEFDLVLHHPDGTTEPMKIGGGEASTREVVLKHVGGNAELHKQVSEDTDPEWNEPVGTFTQRSAGHKAKVLGLLDKAGWRPAEPEQEEPEAEA